MSSSTPPAKIAYNYIDSKKTKLGNKFAFWYHIIEDLYQQNFYHKKELYDNQVKKIGEFDTIEDFWALFQHLRKPDSCKQGIEFQLFKNNINPIWEDENNKNGGKISIKLRKYFTTIIWEEMIFAFISNVLPKEIYDEINGIVVSSKKDYNDLQIWIKNCGDKTMNNKFQMCIRDLLQIPSEVKLEFKPFFTNNKFNLVEI